MCEFTGRSGANPRPPPSSITLPTGKACIRAGIWHPMRGYFRPMPMADTTTSTKQAEDQGRSPRPRAGATGAASASCSPLAHEAVRRIDPIFDAERALNGLVADKRLELRRTCVAPLVTDLETW